MKFYRTALFLISLFILSCGNNLFSPSQYISYLQNADHGLQQKQVIEGVSFKVQYKPLEYVCLQELQSDKLSPEELEKTEDKFRGLEYFTFTIFSNDNHSDPLRIGAISDEEYFQRSDYLSFGIKKDFRLLIGSDSFRCVLTHFERNYSIAPQADVVLGFEKQESAEENRHHDLRFIFNDELYGSGIHEFTIKESDLDNIPALQTI